MKKKQMLFLFLVLASSFVLLTGCSGRDDQGNMPSATAATSADGDTQTDGQGESGRESSGAGSGSTGSTEGETGVLEGLMDGAEEEAEKMYDKGRDALEEGQENRKGSTETGESMNR